MDNKSFDPQPDLNKLTEVAEIRSRFLDKGYALEEEDERLKLPREQGLLRILHPSLDEDADVAEDKLLGGMRNCLQAQGGCEETIPTHPKKRKWEELD
jgi:hypothetical protein